MVTYFPIVLFCRCSWGWCPYYMGRSNAPNWLSSNFSWKDNVSATAVLFAGPIWPETLSNELKQANTLLWHHSVLRICKTFRKHAYSNILKVLPLKSGIFSDKNSDIFHVSVQNKDCGYSLEPPRRGGSYEYPQSMFLSRNKKNNVYPCKPQFYYIKVGFKGVKII